MSMCSLRVTDRLVQWLLFAIYLITDGMVTLRQQTVSFQAISCHNVLFDPCDHTCQVTLDISGSPIENTPVKLPWIFPGAPLKMANMGPIWGRQDPGEPQVGPMNFVIWVGANQVTSHYLNAWWFILLTYICFTQTQWGKSLFSFHSILNHLISQILVHATAAELSHQQCHVQKFNSDYFVRIATRTKQN